MNTKTKGRAGWHQATPNTDFKLRLQIYQHHLLDESVSICHQHAVVDLKEGHAHGKA